MKGIYISLLLVFVFGSVNLIHAQTKTQHFLAVDGTLNFQKRPYYLIWSSHPSADYYKQEYIQKGEKITRFKTMLLLEVLSSSVKLTEIIEAKVNELKAVKAGNPIVQYEVFSNAKNGEYLIDFLLTSNVDDSTSAIAERNVYRYKTITTKDGKSAVLLFGASTRSYGNNITAFLTELKSSKKNLINDVVQFRLPELKL